MFTSIRLERRRHSVTGEPPGQPRTEDRTHVRLMARREAFNAFGTRVQLFEAGPRILSTEDEDVSAAAAIAFRESGMVVRENFGTIESFEKTPSGVRMNFSKNGKRESAEGALVVVAVGWVANSAELNLPAAGVELNQRKFVKVDEYLRTTARHIFAPVT